MVARGPQSPVFLAAESADVKEKVAIQSKIDAVFQLALEDVVNLDPMILQPAKDTMIRC